MRLLLAALLAAAADALNLSYAIGSHMVLQRDKEAVLFGFAAPGVQVNVTALGSTFTNVTGADGVWRQALPAQPATTTGIDIVIASSDGDTQALTDVLFGEVILCSGQSNMGLEVNVLYNYTDVLAAAAEYPLLRMFGASGLVNSSTPLPQLPTKGLLPWQVASTNATAPTSPLATYSAACYITGLTLTQLTGGALPVGLVLSAHGGSSIQAWVTADAEAPCGGRPGGGDWYSGILWNSNIYPLAVGPLQIGSAVWYQGEEDIGLGPSESYQRADWYRCMLPVLVAEWRAAFAAPSLPFVIEQMHAWLHGGPEDIGLALFRDMQQDFVTVADNVGMSTAFDGGDPAFAMAGNPGGTVHSRFKFIPGRRIAYTLAGKFLGVRVPFLNPAYASAVATSFLLPDNKTAQLTVNVSFVPGTIGGGLVMVPADPASNSSICPIARGVNATSCAAARIQINDVPNNGTWLDAVVSVTPDGTGVSLQAQTTIGGGSVVAVATSNGYGDWPVTRVYTTEGFPMLPWNRPLALAA